MRVRDAVLLGVMFLIGGCTTTANEPKPQTAGPRPPDAQSLVMTWIQGDRLYKKMSDITISEVRQGERWTGVPGLTGHGRVPSWYVCLTFKKALFLHKRRDGPYVVWIRDNKVLYATHVVDDLSSRHEC